MTRADLCLTCFTVTNCYPISIKEENEMINPKALFYGPLLLVLVVFLLSLLSGG